VCAVTYTYKVTRRSGDGTSTSTYHWSVVSVDLPAALPPVEVGDEGLLDSFGLGGVRFESTAFNDRFRVSCDDPRYASALVHPRMMGLMLARQRGSPGYAVTSSSTSRNARPNPRSWRRPGTTSSTWSSSSHGSSSPTTELRALRAGRDR